MARKKTTPAEEPKQNGEDVFPEQTGETAKGFTGVEDPGGEVGVDGTEAPGKGSIGQPGPGSMTPLLEESEAIMPPNETSSEDAEGIALPVEISEEEPPGERPHETVGPGMAPLLGGEEAEWPPTKGSA